MKATGDKKPTVLIVSERFANFDTDIMSNHTYGMIGSLVNTGTAHVRTFWYDEFLLHNPWENPSCAFAQFVEAVKPDLVVATTLFQLTEEWRIGPDAYGKVNQKTPVIMLIYESSPDALAACDEYAPYVTASIVVDRVEAPTLVKHQDKCKFLLEPRDTGHFYDKEAVRDRPISYGGSLLSRPMRCAALANLMANGVKVSKYGGWNEDRLPFALYVDCLQRSAITLNFTSAGSYKHMTGRCAEAMLCGSMVMEEEGADTDKFLEPFVDYVPWNMDNIVELARRYIEDEPERKKIAENGKRKALELFDGRLFWRQMFETAGLAS